MSDAKKKHSKKSGVFIPQDDLLGEEIELVFDRYAGHGGYMGEGTAFHPPPTAFRGRSCDVDMDDYQEGRFRKAWRTSFELKFDD